MAKDEKIYGAADASQGVPVETTDSDARVAVTPSYGQHRYCDECRRSVNIATPCKHMREMA